MSALCDNVLITVDFIKLLGLYIDRALNKGVKPVITWATVLVGVDWKYN